MRKNPFNDIYKAVNTKQAPTQYPQLPIYIDVELTNYCNFNCLMCPTGTKSMKRPQGFMDIQLFKKLIEEIAPHNVAIRFIRWGEPMLHPHFFDFIQMTKEAGLLCHFNTNGALLDEQSILRLIELKVDSIKFSFQGTDDKTYSEMRHGEDFNQLVDKISLFNRLRGSLPYPYLHAATTTTYETEVMISEYKNLLSKYCDLVTYGKTQLDHIDINDIRLPQEIKKVFSELKQSDSINKKFSYCNEVFLKLSINWDGKVTACCQDYDGLMIVGDLKKNSLSEIYHSDKISKYREILSQYRHSELPLCASCYDVMEVKSE